MTAIRSRGNLIHLIWFFPLVILIVLTATGSRVTDQDIRRQLLKAWGVKEAQLERLSFLVKDADLSATMPNSLLPHPPHQHSVPLGFSVQGSGFSLIFPHFGDGEIGGDRRFQTSWVLSTFTESSSDAEGFLEVYDNEGNLQEITVNGQTAAVFEFLLKPDQVQKFTTSGQGAVKDGWVLVRSDQPVGGTSIFGIRDRNNRVVTDVGVGVAEPGEEFTIFADTIADSSTGVAVVNPDQSQTLSLDFELYDPDGIMVATERRQLGPRSHFARFLPEIFSGVIGIQEFEGSVVIRSVADPQLAATGPMGPFSPTRSKNSMAGDLMTRGTSGQELPPPKNLSAQVEGENRVVLSWDFPEPPDGGGPKQFVDETEPNDDFPEADPFRLGQTARGTIDPEFDADVWRFEGLAGQNIVIDVKAERQGSPLDSAIVLYLDQDLDDDGFPDEVIDFNDDFGDSLDSHLEVTLPATGGYFIDIFDVFEEGGPDRFYEMSLSLAPGTTSGNDLGSATAGPTLQGFNIYRALNPASPQVDPADRIANVGAQVTTYTDDSAQAGNTYNFAVTAVYDQGESAPSGPVGATTPGPAPGPGPGPGIGLPFVGITLRSTGDTLTSLPFILPPPEESDVTKLAFAHVGDGEGVGLQVRTSVILVNSTDAAAVGLLEFLNSDSTPMEVTVGGETASSFDFSLPAGGVRRLATTGSGGLKTGWARVTMDQHLAGAGIFSLFEPGLSTSGAIPLGGARRLVSEVGVSPDPLLDRARILVDTSESFNTGLALAFPISTTPDDQRISISIYDETGTFRASTQVQLSAFQHNARFVTELFAETEGLDLEDFEGSLQIGSNSLFTALALRAVGGKLTSTPTLVEKNGFGPVSTLEFAQNLAGTSPSLTWLLHQNRDDLSLEKIRISAPDLGLNTDQVEVGGQIAFGYLARDGNSQVFEFIVKEKEDGKLVFDTAITNSEGVKVQGEGRLEGGPNGNLLLEVELLGKEPFTGVGDDADQKYFLPANLIRAPAAPKTVTVTTDFTSVSNDPVKDLPISRRTTQEIEFVPPDPVKANIHRILPQFPKPGQTVFVEGTNLGEASVVSIPISGDDTAEVDLLERGGGLWEVQVPEIFVDGAFQIDNGSGKGNTLQVKSLFSPTFEMGFTESDETQTQGAVAEDGFFFLFSQPVEQFLMASFQVELSQTDTTLADLVEGAEVGTLTIAGPSSTQRMLTVQSATADTATLSASGIGTLTLERFSDVEGEAALRAEEGYEQQKQVACEECINELFSKMKLTPPIIKLLETDSVKTSLASLGTDATWRIRKTPDPLVVKEGSLSTTSGSETMIQVVPELVMKDRRLVNVPGFIPLVQFLPIKTNLEGRRPAEGSRLWYSAGALAPDSRLPSSARRVGLTHLPPVAG